MHLEAYWKAAEKRRITKFIERGQERLDTVRTGEHLDKERKCRNEEEEFKDARRQIKKWLRRD